MRNGNFGLYDGLIKPGEDNVQARDRLYKELQRFMIRKGYKYTGKCSSEYMKSQPAYGAP